MYGRIIFCACNKLRSLLSQTPAVFFFLDRAEERQRIFFFCTNLFLVACYNWCILVCKLLTDFDMLLTTVMRAHLCAGQRFSSEKNVSLSFYLRILSILFWLMFLNMWVISCEIRMQYWISIHVWTKYKSSKVKIILNYYYCCHEMMKEKLNHTVLSLYHIVSSEKSFANRSF